MALHSGYSWSGPAYLHLLSMRYVLQQAKINIYLESAAVANYRAHQAETYSQKYHSSAIAIELADDRRARRVLRN